MATSEHLQVDLADPEDIRAKLPEARELYETKRRELDELAAQVRHWGELVNLLGALVGERGISPAGRAAEAVRPRKTAPGQERAVAALEKAGRPMGPTALFDYMVAERLDAPKSANALGANLWQAAKAGRIQKTSDGLYAPLGWRPSQSSLGDESVADESSPNGASRDGEARDRVEE